VSFRWFVEGNVNTQDIIEQIDSEIATLQQAKTLLLGATAASNKRWPGRPKGQSRADPG